MTLDAQIEAILFFKSEPVKIEKIATILSTDESAIQQGLAVLEEKLYERGVVLLRKDDEVSLVTAPEMSETIQKLTKEEFSHDLGKAAIETLTIVLYKSPVSKPEIDYLRGVNSNYILRNLLVRGLIEKISSPSDQRSFLYRPTFELLEYLGIKNLLDLPEREVFKNKTEENFQEIEKESP